MPDKILSDALLLSGSWRRLSERSRVLFPAAMLAYTDEWGLASADLDSLHALHPGLPWSDADLLAVIEELVAERVLALYCAEGRWYLWLINHDHFQRRWLGLRKRHGSSRHPPPPAAITDSAKSPANTESAVRTTEAANRVCRDFREAHARARGLEGPLGVSGVPALPAENPAAEQLHTEASFAARAALPDFTLETAGAEIERKLSARAAPSGDLGRLLEVLGDVAEASVKVLQSHFAGLPAEAIERAREEILRYQPRNPPAYAVGIARRLGGADVTRRHRRSA